MSRVGSVDSKCIDMEIDMHDKGNAFLLITILAAQVHHCTSSDADVYSKEHTRQPYRKDTDLANAGQSLDSVLSRYHLKHVTQTN